MEKGAMKRMGYFAALMAALLLLAIGCASGAGSPKELQGHWVDVNGKTTLDISGNKFTITRGTWSETCKFRVKTEDDMTYLVNPEKDLYHFDMMTAIRVCDDGSLEASEMLFDGDPLDILVICSDPTFPGCVVPARVLGYLDMEDGGKLDYKLISVVDCDPRYDDVQELEHLSPFVLKEIANFFSNYKVLQGVSVTVGSYHGKDEAIEIIKLCRDAYTLKE